MKKLVPGINDLETMFPEIAKEADGWDPSTLLPGSHKKMAWKCKKGHKWEAMLNGRTGENKGCPYCSNRILLIGFNDLKSQYPDVASEADGWDPEKILFGTAKKMPWKCKEGHTWKSKVVSRTRQGQGCPFCRNVKVLAGFNDLETHFPEIAAEADGWDPKTVAKGSKKRLPWECKKGHKWNIDVDTRTRQGQNCPYCSNHRVLKGFNDLATLHPDLVEEADGWDPSTLVPGSNEKRTWKCSLGHEWEAVIDERTRGGTGCPYCSNKRVLKGFNDLATLHPDLVEEADGWDPSTFVAGTDKKMLWKCKEYGHRWKASIVGRTSMKYGCPYCSSTKLLKGFNDLATRFPDVAKEADGWDPSTVISGSSLSKNWVCDKGHKWTSRVINRTSTRDRCGCPECAETGYNPGKPGWFYLMKRNGEQQFGITNNKERRLDEHASKGWRQVIHNGKPQVTGPHDGYEIQETEKRLKKWLRKEIGLVEGTTENWYTSKMEVHSLTELKEKSGIETSIF